jgi:hypothetical protein
MGNNCYKFRLLFLTLFVSFALNSCSDLDDDLKVARLQDVIVKDSEMYNLLERVTTQTDDPMEDIVCIDFIYPLEVKLYDANLYEIGSVILFGDDEFSDFLGAIPETQALSISYPIQTMLEDGTTFSVNNNQELKLAIDNCSREDIVSYCNGVFNSGLSPDGTPDCVWRVEYTENRDNKYAGGVFQINPDNSLVFTYKGVDYLGNWIFLFVDDQLHININLEGTSAVAAYWNIDRRMAIWMDVIDIATEPKHILLKRYCQQTEEFAIGDTGPGGGTVFYDKGFYSNGWRYIEAATEDLGFFEWGCAAMQVGDTSAGIGAGLTNSSFVAYTHDNLNDYYNNPSVCNAFNNGTVASHKTMFMLSGNQDDWFLPSEEELLLMYANLQTQGLGNFTQTQYWSSTETDAGNARAVNFTDGTAATVSKIPVSNTIRTRAVRYF